MDAETVKSQGVEYVILPRVEHEQLIEDAVMLSDIR